MIIWWLIKTAVESDEEEFDDSQPFGLGSIVDLLDFITSLINLNDTNNADIIIKTCLSLITVALEVARDQIMEIPQLRPNGPVQVVVSAIVM